MAIRLPVVSSRRCVQRTALGAADVPEVNSKRPEGVHVWLSRRRPVLAPSAVIGPGRL